MNDENLIPLNKRSKSAQREIQEKGREANRLKWKEKLNTREKMRQLLQAPVTNKEGEVVTNPITGEILDNCEAMLLKQLAAARAGDVRAAEFCLRVAGELQPDQQNNTLIVLQQRTPEDAYTAAYGVIEGEARETTTEEDKCEN